MDEFEVEVLVGFSLNENTIFVSRYLDYRHYLLNYLPNLHEKTILQVETCRNKIPYSINKYNLYKHLSPINHKANLITSFKDLKVSCKLILDGRFIMSTPYNTLELHPDFFLVKQQLLGDTYAYSKDVFNQTF